LFLGTSAAYDVAPLQLMLHPWVLTP
jgi:hypothetical protein